MGLARYRHQPGDWKEVERTPIFVGWLEDLPTKSSAHGEVKGRNLTWDTVSKLRNMIVQIYAHAQRNKLIAPDLKYKPVKTSEFGGTGAILTIRP